MKRATSLLALLPLLVLGALVSPFAHAQNGGDFVAGINYLAGPPAGPTNTGYWFYGIYPVEVHTGDFNGDGKPDVVMAASCGLSGIPNCPASGSAVVVYLSNGDGTFGAPIVSGVNLPPSIRSLVVGDFNGDGKPDVAVADDGGSNSGDLTILLGNGDGTFTQSSQYTVNGIFSQATTLAVGDFNGDGKLDLVAGLACYNIPVNCSVGAVSIYLGNGDGTLGTPTSYTIAGDFTIFPVVGDFNGDDKLDVIAVSGLASGGIVSNSSLLTVLLGNGDGTFSQPVNDQVTLPFSSVEAITAGDLNSDGKLDLVLTSYYGNSVYVAFGNGDGSFQAPSVISTALSYQLDSQIIDLNHDGHPDIVVSAQGLPGSLLNGVQVLLNDGTGNFVPASVYGLTGTGGLGQLAISDFNGDGNSDILLGSGGSLSILLGNGDGTMQGAAITSQALGTVYAAITADVNGDGIPDLVESVYVPSYGNQGGILVFLGTGNGQYAAPTLYTAGFATALALVAGDFNNDGKVDIAAVGEGLDGSFAQGEVSLLLGNGDGTFQSPVSYGTGGQYSLSLVTGDFNGDGKLDIAVVNQSSSVSILLGNGDGTLQPAVVTTTGSINFGIAAADFNNDGKTDIAVDYWDPYANRGFVQVLLSGTNGSLSAGGGPYSSGGNGPTYQVNIRGGALAIADVNRDGKLDIVVANQCQSYDTGCSFGSLAVLDGNGDGTFQIGPIQNALQGDGNYYSLFLADINGDGILDAIASDPTGVEVLLGKSDGSFLPPTVYAGVANLGQNTTLALADLNIIQPGAGNASTAVLVNRAGTYLVTQSSANPSNGAQSITLMTTVSGSYLKSSPTGSVTYYEGATNWGSSTIAAGLASINITGLSQGVHTIVPYYSGDSNFFSHYGTPILQVVGSAMASQTITFTTPAPATAKSGDSFTVAATGGGSGNPVVFTAGAGSVCTLSGATYTMTSNTGFCYVVASQAGNSNYAAAPHVIETVTAVKTVTKIAPTVTFTGAPSSAYYNSGFTVATTQNSGVNPTLTATPSTKCTISGNSVTMVSGTGTCTLKAVWATNDYYRAVTLTQLTTAEKLSSSVNWASPSAIAYGTTLSGVLDATGSVPGRFAYKNGATTVTATTVLAAGDDTLSVTFTPTASTDYTTATASVPLTISQDATTTTVTSSNKTVTLSRTGSASATLAFNVSSYKPTGSVTLSTGVGGPSCMGIVSSSTGNGSCRLTFTIAGTYMIGASYPGDANHTGSNNSGQNPPVTVTVNPY